MIFGKKLPNWLKTTRLAVSSHNYVKFGQFVIFLPYRKILSQSGTDKSIFVINFTVLPKNRYFLNVRFSILSTSMRCISANFHSFGLHFFVFQNIYENDLFTSHFISSIFVYFFVFLFSKSKNFLKIRFLSSKPNFKVLFLCQVLLFWTTLVFEKCLWECTSSSLYLTFYFFRPSVPLLR